MSQPVDPVAEAIDLSCRQQMHNAGTAIKEAVKAHCDQDYGTARERLLDAAAFIERAKRFCALPLPEPPAPKQTSLL